MPNLLPTEALPPEHLRLLDQLAAWPFLRIERRGADAAVYYGSRERAIGALDMRTGTLTIDVERDVVDALLERHPRLQPAGGGAQLAVTDAGGLAAAKSLLRWRLDRERFAWQLSVASP